MSDDSGSPDLGGLGESEYPDFHRSTRMPLDAVVRLHFEGTVAYQNGFAANVSATGMYVKHPDPPPIGTRLVFELVLGEERKPVQGAGVVAWARDKYEGPGRPAGIGIQFTEIDALSRQHIAEALFSYLETQLGDELAESQDVVDLVATTSTRTPIELVESIGRDAAQEDEVRPSLPLSPAQPISLYREDVAEEVTRKLPTTPAPRFEAAPDPHVVPEGGLFTPSIPPDEMPRARAASSPPPRSAWPAIAIGAAIAAAAFAGWWFMAGPGSVGDIGPVATAPQTPPANPQPAAPERPPLSATPGTDTTLAQAVGADAVEAPGPLPIGGETGAAPAAAEGATGASETGAVPDQGAPTAAVPTPAPAETSEPAPSAPTSPAAAPASEPSSAAASARATHVATIQWQEATGSTTVVLTGDGDFPSGSYKWNEIRGENPRVLIRIIPVASGFSKTLLAAGTPELKQVRVGYHEKPAGNELHVVLDLASPAVRVESVGTDGSRLVVRLVSR